MFNATMSTINYDEALIRKRIEKSRYENDRKSIKKTLTRGTAVKDKEKAMMQNDFDRLKKKNEKIIKNITLQRVINREAEKDITEGLLISIM